MKKGGKLLYSKTSQKMENIFECAVCYRRYTCKNHVYRHIVKHKHRITNTLPLNELKVTLPRNWKYGNCQVSSARAENSSISIYIYDVCSKNDVVTWMSTYMEENRMKFICRVSRVRKNGQEVYVNYRCEHYKDGNRKTKRKQKVKGTGCKSAIYFLLKRGLAEVKICAIHHNHPLDSAAILRFLKPTAEVEQIFMAMFNSGLGPADALKTYRNHVKLQVNSDIGYLEFSANRSKMPDYNWVHHLFNKNYTKKYSGFAKNDEVMEELKKFINETNAEFRIPVCTYQQNDADTNFIVVIVTPLMTRISATKAAGEFMYFDSISGVGRFGLRVFIMMAKVEIGHVPLGVLVTTNGTQYAIQEALNQFLQQCTENSFGGRGKLGPMYIITNNCEAETAALRKAFPDSKFFLCSFRVLQFTYRWLSKRENGISVVEKNEIYSSVKEMVYTDSIVQLNAIYNFLTDKYKSSTRFIRYIGNLYTKREKWCLLYRRGILLLRESSIMSDRIVDREMWMLKENILNWNKARTPAELLQYLIYEYDVFHVRKLISRVLETNVNNLSGQDNKRNSTNSKYIVIKDEFGNFITVTNKRTNTKYFINVDVGVCSCYIGANGIYCKHQQLLDEETKPPIDHRSSSATLDEQLKIELCYLATGNYTLPDNFLKSLHSESYEVLNHLQMEDSLDVSEIYIFSEQDDGSVEEESLMEPENDDNDELRKFERNIQDLLGIIGKDRSTYSRSLISFNKELETMKAQPNSINQYLCSFKTVG